MDFLSGLNLEKLSTFVYTMGWYQLAKIAVELLIIGYAAVWIWGRIRGTQAERLVKGVLVLTLICFVSWLCGFQLITSILAPLIPVAVLAILIIFQPEIRRGLGYLGRAKTFTLDLALTDSQKYKYTVVIEQIIGAVRELSRNKIGALIVIEPPDSERDYLSPGTTVNGDVSTNLLVTIFFPNSPLHDGAVVVRKDKIVAAGVILHTITENPKLSHRYGTRHRAAIGLSEVYDGLCVVVSEETGSISAASRGMLVRYNSADELYDPLSYLYQEDSDNTSTNPLQFFFNLFNKSKADASTASGGTSEPDRQAQDKLQDMEGEEARL